MLPTTSDPGNHKIYALGEEKLHINFPGDELE
jgi:hypothetical protein